MIPPGIPLSLCNQMDSYVKIMSSTFIARFSVKNNRSFIFLRKIYVYLTFANIVNRDILYKYEKVTTVMADPAMMIE